MTSCHSTSLPSQHKCAFLCNCQLPPRYSLLTLMHITPVINATLGPSMMALSSLYANMHISLHAL